eukprot:9476017-Karenia_brevis.AAC.1
MRGQAQRHSQSLVRRSRPRPIVNRNLPVMCAIRVSQSQHHGLLRPHLMLPDAGLGLLHANLQLVVRKCRLQMMVMMVLAVELISQ